MAEQQPTRSGRHREPRDFDTTQLRENSHGKTVHRDYAAHFFRWVTVKEAVGRDDRVLDIGCGQDMPLVRILGANISHVPFAYVGVDLNRIKSPLSSPWVVVRDQFNFIDRWPELPRLITDKNRLYNEFNPFTVITCFEVIEHMMPENGLKLLQAARELLDPEGTFYLSTPVFDGRAAVNHCHEYTIHELADLIIQAGLEVSARYGTFGNVRQLEKVLSPAERELWGQWAPRLGNDGLSVVFATNHPDQSRNNLWLLRRVGSERRISAPKVDATGSTGTSSSPKVKKRIKKPASEKRAAKSTVFYAIENKEDSYAAKLLDPDSQSHNAFIYRALVAAGEAGLTMDQLLAQLAAAGWETSSKEPRVIAAWHLNELKINRKLVRSA